MVTEIKEELQTEMGLLPVRLLRERRSSFVELYSTDTLGKTNYGTAGYLGHGYFITVKHAVVALKGEDERAAARKIASVTIMYRGKEIPAKVVDAGDADVEVHSGDWAIIRTRELDLPALHVDAAFSYDFAEPIFRLGNDYSKGIILSTGYVGQRTANGLVTCLTDGHPGVSGGGVLDQRGDLVGIPIGRMQGDYRFSFILPLRAEMLRKVPAFETADPHAIVADPQGPSYLAAWKLATASASLSNVSNTVSSFVIDSRSLIRLVTFSSFSLPPFLVTVAYDCTISPSPALSTYDTSPRLSSTFLCPC